MKLILTAMKNLKLIFSASIVTLITIFVICCCKDENPDNNGANTTVYAFPTDNPIYKFPTIKNIPSDNPTTVEGVRLGRYLFYDGRMSGRLEPDSQMSCGTCHLQSHSFECGLNHPKYVNGHPFGVQGKLTPHYMMPFINLVYVTSGYLWKGNVTTTNTALGSTAYGVPAKMPFHLKNIESLVWMGLYAPHEMKSDTTRMLNALRNLIKYPNYPKLYKDAFGTEEITVERTMKAVAQFVRTLISYNSKFDKYIRHEAGGNLSVSELRGYQLFSTETGDCFHCHGNYPLLSTYQYFNNGKDTIFTDPGDRYSFTKDSMDIGAYKAPTLRNIELTAPYMHDGRFKTLEEVVDFYASKVITSKYIHPLMKWAKFGGNQLTQPQKDDLIAFLKTLTDNTFTSDTAFAKPSDL
jgi:cytochrome c peroxidase